MSARGEHLVRADRRFATGGGVLARVAAPAFARILDQLDHRLEKGGIHGTLPDGSKRRIGFQAPGPEPIVQLVSWMALVRLATSGSVGWYKAWALGEWTSPDPVALFELFTANAEALGDSARAKGPFRWVNALAHRLRDNAPGKARDNIAAHYDLGNDFYAAWLDPTMTYSSARFQTPLPQAGREELRSGEGVGLFGIDGPTAQPPPASGRGGLEQAQLRKISIVLDRLQLKRGDRLLDIGCGWGSLAIEAARRGVSVIGLTLSTEQKSWADAKVSEAGLSDRIEIRLADYRDVAGEFDAVASVEMVEAVGQRWWGAYLDCIARNLTVGGRAALQFIIIDHHLFDRYAASADFIQAYIFPGGMLLDEPAFEVLARERRLSWEDRDSFAPDYAETLKRWRGRYETAVGAGRLAGFDQSFHNLWRYYLMYCEGGFRGGAIDVAQVTMVKG
ncbi:MAG: cyclopropane-fatty-acyl-phospholipid synthase family protein [Pseudomonadota bacterium]|nr:cyclopropane-fatty-acyl-phospholipid synthase family protein [Pseudomonadota bacterium]